MSSGGPRGRVRTSDTTTRQIRPRRAWPGSRALVGGVLVAVAALGLFAAYRNAAAEPDTQFVVARRDIAPGQAITADDVGLQTMALPDALASRAFTPVDDALVLGSVAVSQIAEGELLQRSSLRDGGSTTAEATHEISFQIDRSRALNGRLRPGERVDVLATLGVGAQAATSSIEPAVLVVAVDDASSSLATDELIVTIALTDPDAVLSIAAAIDTGQVTLARSPVR